MRAAITGGVRTGETDVLLLAEGGEVRELVLNTAAALDLRVSQAEGLAQVVRLWPEAATVCVEEPLAERVAGWALPKHPAVVLLGKDEAELARWSAPLSALVIALPEGASWLGQVLDESAARVGTPVVAVFGGSGGAGCSTFAAGLALASAAEARPAALVEADMLSGGLDLLLGAENLPGWRWPNLAAASGYVGDLREYLPSVGSVALVASGREAAEVSAEALSAVVHALRRSHDLVVIDGGRSPTPLARQAWQLANWRLLFARPDVRGLAAAASAAGAFADGKEFTAAVVRGHSGAFPDPLIAELLGCPVLAHVGQDRRLVQAAERGDPPGVGRTRPWLKGCRRVARLLLGVPDG
jgi:secretion/DNA translocation related CpaE-like protein